MNVILVTASCLQGCGDLDTGRTDEKPTGRYETRWSQVDAAGTRHTEQTGHATVTRGRPA